MPEEDVTESAALNRLAEAMGILPEYRDARGELRRTTTATKQTLLAAMGVNASNQAEIELALCNLDCEKWRRVLPPVMVTKFSKTPPQIDLILPAATGKITWRLSLENGAEKSESSSFSSLELQETREFEGNTLELRRLELPGQIPLGYHHISVDPGECRASLIVTPGKCWLPQRLAEGGRIWGIAAQLYLLRSATNWGIGDFTDLRRLVELSSAQGADIIGLNPLHAMFDDNPEHASPYSPATRLLLNVLNIDVSAIPEMIESEKTAELKVTFHRDLERLRLQGLLDYTSVARIKLAVLEALYEQFQNSASPFRVKAFSAFRESGGQMLQRSCCFLALREHFARKDPSLASWHAWPEEYKSSMSPAVREFATANKDRVDFLAWLQWVADSQLATAAAAAGSMEVGLYRDVAIGADQWGAEAWANPDTVVSTAQIGAPPDIGNPAGQNWGLPPFSPTALRTEAYRSFIALIRASMRHAGALRIDHVMGLERLFWVPEGRKPSEGAYVRYPIDDLIRILALESCREQCLVVGEDLGTVPAGFRERMADANILSYRVLFFEQDSESRAFHQPGSYPSLAVAVAGNHDLPTLRGWWEGFDLDLRAQLGFFETPNELAQERKQREVDRSELLAAIGHPDDEPGVAQIDKETLTRAVHAFLARTPCAIAMIQIDDLTDENAPVNVPATSDEHANWRRRISMTLGELQASTRLREIAQVFRSERHD